MGESSKNQNCIYPYTTLEYITLLSGVEGSNNFYLN